MRPRLVLGLRNVVYFGPGMQAEAHAHHAIQIVVSFDGPFEIEIEGRAGQASAVAIPSHLTHRLDATGREIALVLVDREGAGARALDELARARTGEDIVNLVRAERPDAELPAVEIGRWGQAVADRLSGTSFTEPALSTIVQSALLRIAGCGARGVRLHDAARAAGISPTRLTHAFTAEVGIPFRRYQLWVRTKLAIEGVRAGQNLTEAAVTAGFSDSAHLSRTFRRTFGLPPSFLLQAEVAGSFLSDE